MKKISSAVGLVFIIIIISGCPKPCIEANYSFEVNSQITPDYDSVHIGDTIYFVSTFPTKLVDQSSGQMIDYYNSTGIGSTLGLVRLEAGIYPGIDAVNEFDYISIIGTVYNDKSTPSPNKFQQLKFQQINDFYKLKIGIIPKEKGVYYLGIGDGLSNGRNKRNSCEKASFSITLNNTKQHLSYFSDWNKSATLSNYEKPRAYFMKVY
jgi:hypothetical protein